MNSKKLKIGIQLLIIACLIVIAYSCKKFKNEPYFIVEVENISAPKTAYVEDTISVYLYGYMDNSCYMISNVGFYPQDDDTTTILIEVYGIQDPYGYFCEEKRTSFEHEHILTFSGPGEYTFVTMQLGSLVEVGKIVMEIKGDIPVILEKPFTAKINRIFTSAAAYVGDAILVYVSGRLDNNCYIVDDAEHELQNNKVLLKATGVEKYGDINCTGSMRDFTHELTVVFTEPGEYTFYDYNKPDTELGKIEIKTKP